MSAGATSPGGEAVPSGRVADHRRRRLHRHQPRRPPARRRARASLILDNLSRPGRRAQPRLAAGSSTAIALRVDAGRRARRRTRCATRWTASTAVFHFAAQVAVTTSLVDPLADFDVNARGTLNAAGGAARAAAAAAAACSPRPTRSTARSTTCALERDGQRYAAARPGARSRTASTSTRPLDFHSPYGCSKGAADQYVLDYARTFGLPTVVFRMSCIYGPHQFGTEDQGWVAHFLIRALDAAADHALRRRQAGARRPLRRRPGRGLAARAAQESIGRWRGQAFNIGGGPGNAISLLELLDATRRSCRAARRRCARRLAGRRPALLRLRHRAVPAATGWRRRSASREGIGRSTAGCEQRHRCCRRPARESRCRSALPAEVSLVSSGARWPAAPRRWSTMRAGGRCRPRPGRGASSRPPRAGPGQVRIRLEGSRRLRLQPARLGGRTVVRLSQSIPARRGTRAGARSRRSAPASPASRRATASRFLSAHAFAEYDVARADAVARAAGAGRCRAVSGEALACAVNIFRRSAIEPGRRVAIVGIGFLGALLTRLAARAGARVIAISRRPFALERRARMRRRRDDPDGRPLAGPRAGAGADGRGAAVRTRHRGGRRAVAARPRRADRPAERGRLVIAGYHQDGPRRSTCSCGTGAASTWSTPTSATRQVTWPGMRAALCDDGATAGSTPTPLFTPPAARFARPRARHGPRRVAPGRLPQGPGHDGIAP